MPALPLPGDYLLAHAVLFAAAAALVIGAAAVAILVGQIIAYGIRRGREYWRGNDE